MGCSPEDASTATDMKVGEESEAHEDRFLDYSAQAMLHVEPRWLRSRSRRKLGQPKRHIFNWQLLTNQPEAPEEDIWEPARCSNGVGTSCSMVSNR
jgi:hypothetical protein